MPDQTNQVLKQSLLEWNQASTFLAYAIFFLLICLGCKRKTSSAKQTIDLGRFLRMPSPPALPFIGHIYLLARYNDNIWEGMQAIRKRYGNVVALKLGVHNMALVSDIDIIRDILLKKGDIFVDRQEFMRYNIIFGGNKENSLALCNYSAVHQDRRRMCKRAIVPGNKSSRYQLLEKLVNNHARELVKHLKQHQKSELLKIDLLFLSSDIFMDFLCREQRSHSDIQYEYYVRGCDYVFWDITQGHVTDVLPALAKVGVEKHYLSDLTDRTARLRAYIIDNIFKPRFQTRRAAMERPNSNSNPTDSDSSELAEEKDYLDDMIDEYLSDSTRMSLSDYRIGLTDLLAGSAAVANILMKLLGHLALDRKTQDLICNEAKEADLSNSNQKPSLPITEASLHEALRLASSPIVPHVATKDTSIGNFYAPKGTTVLFNNYHLNTSKQFWDNPREFQPARFLTSKIDDQTGKVTYTFKPHRHSMPFSIGPRQCLGFRMVEFISIITAAHICSNFILKSNNEDLTRKLLISKGTAALNPDVECYNIELYER